ncbi:MAG TPA: hypothetical protein VFH39_04915, partial [Candidatus Saccharimonadales bacterium]|nr:hypothetical protein [Candidatus Saccharimonadales bacterium]
ESKMPTASILKKRPEEPKRYGLIDAKDEDWSTRQAIKRDGVFSKAEYKQKYGEYRPAVKQVAEAAPRKAVNTEKQPKAPKNNGGKGNGKPESAEKKSNGDNKRAKQAKGNSSVAPETSSKPSDAEAEQLAQPEPTTEEELTAEQKADRDYKAFLEGLSDSEYADVEKLNVYIGKNHLDGSSFKTNDLFGNALGTTQEGRVLDFAKYKEALQHMAATGVLVSDKDTHNNGTPRTYRISPELLEQLRNQATSAQPVGETAATQVAPESTEPAASTSREQVAAANTEPLQTAATETVPAPTADAETAIDGLSPEQQDKISIWLSEYNSQLKPGQGVSLRRIRSAMKRDGIKVKAETLDKLLRTFEDPDSLIRYESYENHGVPYYRRPNEPSRSTARTNAAEQTTAVQAPVQTAEATREPVASPAAEHVADDKMQAFFNQLPDSRERTDFKYIHMFLMRRLRKGQFEGGTLDDWFEHERKGSTITKEHAQRYLDLLAADPSVPIVKNTDGSNGSTYRLDGSAVAQTQEAPRILGFDAEEETPRQRQPESRLSRRERVRRLGQRAVAFDRRSQELVTTFGKKVYKHEPWYKARNLAKEDGRQVAEERAQRERDEAERERIERERRAAEASLVTNP